MDMSQEQVFGDFLESKRADELFGSFQDLIRTAFIEGYKTGQQNPQIQIVYISGKNEKTAGE